MFSHALSQLIESGSVRQLENRWWSLKHGDASAGDQGDCQDKADGENVFVEAAAAKDLENMSKERDKNAID